MSGCEKLHTYPSTGGAFLRRFQSPEESLLSENDVRGKLNDMTKEFDQLIHEKFVLPLQRYLVENLLNDMQPLEALQTSCY